MKMKKMNDSLAKCFIRLITYNMAAVTIIIMCCMIITSADNAIVIHFDQAQCRH